MAFLIYLLTRLIDVYSFVLIVYALLSWFPNAYDSALGKIVVGISEPLLRPFRGLNLQFAGLDFTIVLAIFLLNLLKYFLANLLYF